MPPIRTASRLSVPLGEVMARSSKTLCCKYFLYSKAHDTVTTTRQRIVAPAYLKVFLITVALQTSYPFDSTPGPACLFQVPPTLYANHRTGILRSIQARAPHARLVQPQVNLTALRGDCSYL